MKIKNVEKIYHGPNSINEIISIISFLHKSKKLKYGIYIIDDYFKDNSKIKNFFNLKKNDFIIYIDSSSEPSTNFIDSLVKSIKVKIITNSAFVIGLGGSVTLDIAKSIANLMNNPGLSEKYQGWDLLKNKSLFSVGIPTIFGTGAETSRTCVLTNSKSGLKLGMNSDFTIFNILILDSELTKTVPKKQFFITGMDAFFHSIEILNGRNSNLLSRQLASISKQLCIEIFTHKNMMNQQNREKIIWASYFGGLALTQSFPGVLHPLSAALGVLLKTPHCLSNCIIMTKLKYFYKDEYILFNKMLKIQKINLPKNLSKNFDKEDFNKLYKLSIIHEKPLNNALGKNFKKILTKNFITKIFKSI